MQMVTKHFLDVEEQVALTEKVGEASRALKDLLIYIETLHDRTRHLSHGMMSELEQAAHIVINVVEDQLCNTPLIRLNRELADILEELRRAREEELFDRRFYRTMEWMRPLRRWFTTVLDMRNTGELHHLEVRYLIRQTEEAVDAAAEAFDLDPDIVRDSLHRPAQERQAGRDRVAQARALGWRGDQPDQAQDFMRDWL